MNLPDDFRDLLVNLADAGADFIIVGGHAVARHGHVRATKDIDVLVRPDLDNATRVVQALAAFGAPLRALGVGVDDFSRPGQVVQLGVPPLRIGLITSISGVSYDEAVGDPENKRASARPQDLADVDALERRSAKKRPS